MLTVKYIGRGDCVTFLDDLSDRPVYFPVALTSVGAGRKVSDSCGIFDARSEQSETELCNKRSVKDIEYGF